MRLDDIDNDKVVEAVLEEENEVFRSGQGHHQTGLIGRFLTILKHVVFRHTP